VGVSVPGFGEDVLRDQAAVVAEIEKNIGKTRAGK
jgi:hypothetical protein